MYVKICRVPGSDALLPLPQYQTDGSSGMDLHADLSTSVDKYVILTPGERKLIKTGISVQLPEGFEAQIRSRSGLALKQGISVLNSPGTIDSDFIGQIGVILINHSKDSVLIAHGDRIAQIVFAFVSKVNLEEVEVLEPTSRGAGGFGSSGVSRRSAMKELTALTESFGGYAMEFKEPSKPVDPLDSFWADRLEIFVASTLGLSIVLGLFLLGHYLW